MKDFIKLDKPVVKVCDICKEEKECSHETKRRNYNRDHYVRVKQTRRAKRHFRRIKYYKLKYYCYECVVLEGI